MLLSLIIWSCSGNQGSFLLRKGKPWPNLFHNPHSTADQHFTSHHHRPSTSITRATAGLERKHHQFTSLETGGFFPATNKDQLHSGRTRRQRDHNQYIKIATNIERPEAQRGHPPETLRTDDRPALEDIPPLGQHTSPKLEHNNDALSSNGESNRTRNQNPNLLLPGSKATSNRRPCDHGFIAASENDPENCTSDRHHFPAAVLMIEAHYNQTVRDFLQICTPIEHMEIDGVDDAQALLDAIYQQMLLTSDANQAGDVFMPASVVLLFNLENFANWTNERVIEILRTVVHVLQSDYKELTIYSKFHQDGSESNDTHLLQLRYEVKYWLADLCRGSSNQVACADFASIILESVLHLSELEVAVESDSTTMPSLEDAASNQANAYDFTL